MKETKSKRRNYKRDVILGNVLVVVVILVVLLTYFREETQNRYNRNREQFEAVTSSVGQTILGQLESHQELVDSAAYYINGKSMTMYEAAKYARDINLEENHMFHLVWVDDFTGFSTKASKLDSKNFTVDYSKIMSVRNTGSSIITVMDKFLDENKSTKIHATRAFNNPTDAESSVAFYNRITLMRDGQQAQALIMLLVSVSDLRSEYSFPEGIFEDTKTAIIDTETGYYIIPTPELKNTSFFEYIRQYNNMDYVELGELEERIAGEDTISETFTDYKGEENRYIISKVKSADSWSLVCFLPTEQLDNISSDFLWQVTVMLIVLVVILLAFDLLYFLHLNSTLERHLISEEAAKLEAEKANKSKSDFLSTMSHDIRTPLNAIIGLTSLARQRVEDTEYVADSLKKIDQSGSHLLTLINDILDISKIENGELNFSINPFGLSDVEEYLKGLCQTAADDKNIKLDVKVEAVSDKPLLGDKLRIYQVMINILSNAIKYTKAGGSVSARLTEEPEGTDKARLTYVVKDTGIGMSTEFMEHMYEPFSRAKDGRIDKIQGTGLGLAICKRIMDEMQGTIECESKVGEGSTFTVRCVLPLAEEGEEGAAATTTTTTTGFGKGLSLLVAEDNDLNWDIISDMLELKEIKAERAENGQLAYEKLVSAAEHKDFDLVLMDIQMPY